MNLLLDTHALLWWLSGDERLPAGVRQRVADRGNGIFVSAASLWEITTKHRLGKLPGVAAIVGELEQVIADQGFLPLQITLRHGRMAGALPGPHRDPFDRMLIAQALAETLVLLSNEEPFDAYGVSRLW